VTPILSVVNSKKNGPLIAQAAQLWINPEDTVVDVTYGRGLFWATYQHPGPFTAHDITLDGVDFRHLPEDDASVDVVIYDPPYISPGGRKTSTVTDFNLRYGLVDVPRTPAETDTLIVAGMTEAVRVLRRNGRLFVKCADYVTSGKLHLGHHMVVSAALHLGLEQVDEFVHHSGTGPQPKYNLDGTPRRQVHSRRSHSFLCVFKKGRR
jgi:tRNA G10  N-methylase Trm11